MITRQIFLRLSDRAVPDASVELESEGFAVVREAFRADEVAALRADIESVFESFEPDVRGGSISVEERNDFRYELFNRSAAAQDLVGDRRILDVVEPLLAEDCHVIANTAWRNPPRHAAGHPGGNWHIDAGPHVPRPAEVPWDDRIPYPVFAIGVHVLLQDCTSDDGPTAVIPRSHRSGQAPPFDRITDAGLTYDECGAQEVTGSAGDVIFFVSDLWHRRSTTGPLDHGRFFVQVHYGRRDIAQRVRTTDSAHQLSDAARARATKGADSRARTVLGLHEPFFYDG